MKTELVKILTEAVEVKVDLKKIGHGLIDQILEPALQKVVDDTTNPFDNAAMAMVYPTLEVEVKKLLDAQVEKLEAIIAAKLAELKA